MVLMQRITKIAENLLVGDAVLAPSSPAAPTSSLRKLALTLTPGPSKKARRPSRGLFHQTVPV
jgi:hypothetical protein